MTPHKVQLVRELKPIDHPMRFPLAKWTCDRLTEDADFGKKKIIFLGEAHFDLSRCVNTQSCRNWSTENPHVYIKRRPKTRNCLVRILVQRHNWAFWDLQFKVDSELQIFLRNFSCKFYYIPCVFARNPLRARRQKIFFHIFVLMSDLGCESWL